MLDGVGCGELPDAGAYGDGGSNTLGHVDRVVGLRLPQLRRLGLARAALLDDQPAGRASGAYGRMAEASPGKDSITGHWEMTGAVLERPFPTFPNGFPADVIERFTRRIGRGILGNVVASGTEIIARLGAEHVRTGAPIVYTSADSVFQVAAHEDVISVAEQRRICQIAFDLVGTGSRVGRVISRPFVGRDGAFVRTTNRHDFALPPPEDTLLDRLTAATIPVVAIGKVSELFAGRGVMRAVSTTSDADGVARLHEAMDHPDGGLIFVNLVDFDTVYGHRNDAGGFAANLERFDAALPGILNTMRETDLLVITADHGNDPTTPSTDHSREYVPILCAGTRVRANVDLGTRASFADLGQTIAQNFGVGPLPHGISMLADLVGADGGEDRVQHP